jgi:hypothetical protein
MQRRLGSHTVVDQVGEGFLIRSRGTSLLLDAGPGVASNLPTSIAEHLDAIVLSSGDLRDIAGLLRVLERRSEGPKPLTVVFPLGEERTSAILDAWERGWPDRLTLLQDGVHPGSTVQIGSIELEPCALRRLEAFRGHWVPIQGLAWRFHISGQTIAYARGACFDRSLEHLVSESVLVILDVRQPGANASHHRLTADQAQRFQTSTNDLWVVTEGGEDISPPSH